MIAGAQGRLPARSSEPLSFGDRGADTARIILAIVVAQGERVIGAVATAYPVHFLHKAARIGQDFAYSDAVDMAEFEPVAVEIVVIGCRDQAPVGVGRLHGPGQPILAVTAFEVVVLRGCVTLQRIAGKVIGGQAEICFIGSLVGVTEFELQRLKKGCGGVRCNPELGQVIFQLVTGVAVGKSLEPIAFLLHRFDQPARAVAAAAGIAIEFLVPVAARHQAQEDSRCVWNSGRTQVDRAAGGSWSHADRGRSFQYLHAFHAALGRKVISRRRGIRRRRDQDAVFEHGDPGAAVEAGSANTDIGPQTEAFLFLYIDTGHRTQHPENIVVVEFRELFLVHHVRRARDILESIETAENTERVEGERSLVSSFRLAGRGRFGWWRWLRKNGHGQQQKCPQGGRTVHRFLRIYRKRNGLYGLQQQM